MRDFAKISGRFWTGETGRCLRQLGNDAQLMALYLMTAPNSNMLGLYYLPIPTLAHELRSPSEGAREVLRRVESTGFCRYDEASETVWVVNMAREQIGESLARNDNRVKAVQKQLEEYRKCPFHGLFHAKYSDAYHLEPMPTVEPASSPLKAPSDPLRSQEKEKEKEKETKAGAATRLVLAPASAKDGDNRVVWAESDVEAVWAMYPKPGGSKQPGCASIRLALADLAAQGFEHPAAVLKERVRAWFAWHTAELRKQQSKPNHFVASPGYAQGWFNPRGPKGRRRYMDDEALKAPQCVAADVDPLEEIERKQAQALAEMEVPDANHVAA